jgi:hypothetical protein
VKMPRENLDLHLTDCHHRVGFESISNESWRCPTVQD